jgi:bla regulator protein BlaR1
MAEHVARRLSLNRVLLLGAAAALALAVWVALGVVHAESSQTGNAAAEGKDLKFSAVSIRQNKSNGPQIFGKSTPDGYEMRNMFLAAAILTAYVPRTGGARIYSDEQVVGLPIWLVSDDDRYDLDAKVDEADLSDWQNPTKQSALLRAMLQTMLADRLKLKVHRSRKQAPVYALVVGKRGPRFKESVPGESHPGAYPMPGGGMLSMEPKDGWVMTHYFDISIGQLISIVLPTPGRTVQDETSLGGKYDMTIERPAPTASGTLAAPPPNAELSAGEIADQLGLKLNPAEGSVETLVIDHVERPSPN